ncbi:MAG: hypothetical protein ACE5IR_11785 [bacterium]
MFKYKQKAWVAALSVFVVSVVKDYVGLPEEATQSFLDLIWSFEGLKSFGLGVAGWVLTYAVPNVRAIFSGLQT